MILDDLEELIIPLRNSILAPIEFPVPDFRLDLESRSESPERQFTHIHQMCTLHAENFAISHKIKLVSLIDGYQVVAKSENPLGPYLFARSVMELAAFVYRVSIELNKIKGEPDNDWKGKGRAYFKLIVRARMATTDPKKRQALIDAGCPAESLEPLNVMHCIKLLVSDSEASESLSHQYEKLCDYVHHNLSSQVTSSSGFRVGYTARSAGGGGLIMPKGGSIDRYEYPTPQKAALAVQETLPVVIKCVELCLKHLNKMPYTPFSQAQIREMTGSDLGFTMVSAPPHQQKPSVEAAHLQRKLVNRSPYVEPGRNDPCYCGSGKKFKFCHGNGKMTVH